MGQLQALAIGCEKRQRQAPQLFVGVHAHRAHQRQRVAVSPNQYVLAVVKRQALVHDPTGPTTGVRSRLQQLHLPAGLNRVHSG
mgnify:CR=1 FL=1